MDGEQMDGDAGLVSGRVQREKKRSYKDFLVDVEDLEEQESDDEEYGTKRPHKEPKTLHKRKRPCNSRAAPQSFGVKSPGFVSVYPVCVPQGRWRETGAEEANNSSIVEYWVHLEDQQDIADCPITDLITSTAGLNGFASPVSFITDMADPTSSVCSPPSSASDTPRSTSRGPGCSDLDPINAAAHLHLLGESLSLIGQQLQQTNKMVCVSGSLSLLLDSLLCALAPLVCLTSQIQELRSCTQHTLADTLENIAYVMPGL